MKALCQVHYIPPKSSLSSISQVKKPGLRVQDWILGLLLTDQQTQCLMCSLGVAVYREMYK